MKKAHTIQASAVRYLSGVLDEEVEGMARQGYRLVSVEPHYLDVNGVPTQVAYFEKEPPMVPLILEGLSVADLDHILEQVLAGKEVLIGASCVKVKRPPGRFLKLGDVSTVKNGGGWTCFVVTVYFEGQTTSIGGPA